MGYLDVHFQVCIAKELTQYCLLDVDFLQLRGQLGEETMVAGEILVRGKPKECLEHVCHVSFNTNAVISWRAVPNAYASQLLKMLNNLGNS